MRVRCYNCGYGPKDKGAFIRGNSNGDFAWQDFSCGQCSSSNPPLADYDPYPGDLPPPPGFLKNREWKLILGSDGIKIRGRNLISPIKMDHQLIDISIIIVYEALDETTVKRLKFFLQDREPDVLLWRQPGIEGITFRHLDAFLRARYKDRTQQFHDRCDAIREERDADRYPYESEKDWIDRTKGWYQRVVDDAREVCIVGPYAQATEQEFDLLELEVRAELVRTLHKLMQ